MAVKRTVALVVLYVACVIGQHRAPPPGVPPQQYQQAPSAPGQYQAQPQHYQASPPGVNPGQYQQQQQPQYQQHPSPPQQQQYQPPAQPPPPQQHQQGQGGHGTHGQQQVLHNPNLNQEREHIKDHLEVPLDTAGMSEAELQFHYFKMHDADNNNMLDGQELIKSLFHWHDAENHDPSKTGHPPPEAKIFTDEELIRMIDPILEQDDRSRDGYIDYPEFVQAQRNAASANAV